MDNRLEDWFEHLFEEQDERYISTMIAYMMLKEDKEVAWNLTYACLEDACLGGYVYIKGEEGDTVE